MEIHAIKQLHFALNLYRWRSKTVCEDAMRMLAANGYFFFVHNQSGLGLLADVALHAAGARVCV